MFRLVALSVALAAPSQALALSCANGPLHTFPADGQDEVPTNAVVRVTFLWDSPDATPIALVDAAGEVVDADLVQVSEGEAGEDVWALEPTASLAPLATYELQVRFDEQDPWVMASFTTGDEADHVLPDAPIVLDVDRDRGRGIWGKWLYNEIQVVPADEPVMYEVDVASDAEFSDVRTVQVSGWPDQDWVAVSVGSGLCGGSLELDGADRHVRIRAIDLAGNMSVEDVDEKVGGCSSTATPVGGGVAILLGLFGLGLGRRRRR